MRHWESLVDRLLKDAIGNGDISHLPGAGKPLNLDDDTYTPDDMRIAYKMMQENDVAPEWMMLGKTLQTKEDKFTIQINIRTDRYLRDLKKARRRGLLQKEIEIEEGWERYLDDFQKNISKYNKEVLLYNLKVPPSISHKQLLSAEKLVEQARENQKGDKISP